MQVRWRMNELCCCPTPCSSSFWLRLRLRYLPFSSIVCCIVHRLAPISCFLIFHIDCHPDGEWFRSCFRRFTQILELVSHFSTCLSSSGFPDILLQMTIGKTYSGRILFLLAKDDFPLCLQDRKGRSLRSVSSPPNFNDDRLRAWVRGYRSPLFTPQVHSQLISSTAISPWTESFSYLVTWKIARLAM